MRVKLVGVLRNRLGRDEISEELSKSIKLREFLKKLRSEIPDLREAVEEDGTLTTSYIAFLNNIDYRLLGGSEYELKDGDEVSLVPISHGG
ncbi:MAG: MoaD/ThiS family protein [Thermoprotei archaeon]